MLPPPVHGHYERLDLGPPLPMERIVFRVVTPPRSPRGCRISYLIGLGLVLVLLLCAILAFWTGRFPSMQPKAVAATRSNVQSAPARTGVLTPVPVIPTERLKNVTPFVSPSPSATPVKYRVQSGDTLAAIALKYSVSVQALMTANGLKNNVVRPGDEFIIPSSTPLLTPTVR